MAERTRAQLISDATTFLPDNDDREISPGSVRQRIIDLADSLALRDELGDAAETTVASAATVDLGAANTRRFAVTGTTTITSFGAGANLERIVRFTNILTLTHNATTLILPTTANITTAAGDVLRAESDASGNWRVSSYMRANGKPLGQPPTPATDNTVVLASSTARYNAIYSNRFYADANAYFGMSGTVVATFFDTTAEGSSYLQFDRTSLATSLIVENANAYIWTHATGTGAGAFYPGADNIKSLGFGAAAGRWTVVYAVTGTINTSDAREKTKVTAMKPAEIAAASELARMIGTFQFLEAVDKKGVRGARRHVGLTVQEAIAIMQSHGLDPFKYAFICRDAWEAQPAVPADPENMVLAQPATPAGDRLGFRPDQLALFIARGQEARLAALEARLPA